MTLFMCVNRAGVMVSSKLSSSKLVTGVGEPRALLSEYSDVEECRGSLCRLPSSSLPSLAGDRERESLERGIRLTKLYDGKVLRLTASPFGGCSA